jgi:LmbE family N-acetylglucosaminyl deacetylase
MKLTKSTADVFIPDGSTVDQALSRTTHMAIAAHPDDIEIMAYEGIVTCFNQPERWFTSVTVTNGSTAPRDFLYKDYSDEKMAATRRLEQRKAGIVGEYSAVIQLDYHSAEVRDKTNNGVFADVVKIFSIAHPQVVYTHNLADKHDTHISVTLKTIQALRSLPINLRPQAVYGCEVWRDLDWLLDDDKVIMDVSAHPNLAAALLALFDTQNSGSKRYDIASIGRRTANAIYQESHGTGGASMLSFAMDLTPLIQNLNLDPTHYATDVIEHFKQDVAARIQKLQQ